MFFLADIHFFIIIGGDRNKMFAATKAIPSYYNPEESYYDYWLRWVQEDNMTEPQLGLPCKVDH